MGPNPHIPVKPGGFLKLLLVLWICLPLIPLDAQWTQEEQFDDSDMALDLSEALRFQHYPTYDHYLEMMQGFASDYPEICRLDTFGTSAKGRLLLALKISQNVDLEEAEASFLYTSSMHGDEIVGYVLLLRLADTLLKGYGNDAELSALVDNLSIWINPLANPDGSFYYDNNLSLKNAHRETVSGVDLNRHFPDPTLGEADDTTGREPENRHMMNFLKEHGFSMSANIHGGTEVVNYPWDYAYKLHADDPWYRLISHEYADEAMAVDPSYMFGWPDGGITNGAEWFVARGTRQDYVNYYLGGREVTLELATEKLLPSSDLEHYWDINERSLINYMSQCMYGIRGIVTDMDSGDPLQAKIRIPQHDSAYSVVYSSESNGDFYRLIKEGVYDLVVSAQGYYNDTILSVTVNDYQATLLDIQLEKNNYAGLPDPEKESGFLIYPNPASDHFFVDPGNIPPGMLEITILTMDGRVVYKHTHTFSAEDIAISAGPMEPGIYLLRCTGGSRAETHRLVVL